MTQQELIKELLSLPEEGQDKVFNFIISLKQRYIKNEYHHQVLDDDIKNDSFFGMWRDRQSFENSTNWVRNIREQEW